jgi:hypothetical protein
MKRMSTILDAKASGSAALSPWGLWYSAFLVYPFKIRKENKRDIRVWLQDGANDLENDHGSWPLQNIQMANSLKMKNYDFHLSFGNGTHNSAHGNAEAPVALTWLWRDYDAGKTEQVYEMEPSEKAKPLFRVKIANRE